MKKILTIILDGLGFRNDLEGKLVPTVNIPTFNDLWDNYPKSTLIASGEKIGLAKGQCSNSKIGHMTIGAGRVIKQKKVLVDEFFQNTNLEDKNVIKLLKQKNKDVHIMGILSEDTKEANIEHFSKMFKFLVDNEFKSIHFHLIIDANNKKNAMKLINVIKSDIKTYGVGDIATVCGRFYALAGEQDYDRLKVYYDLVTSGEGIHTLNIANAVVSAEENISNDEFLKPIIASNNTIKDGDAVIWMNYKATNSKGILDALVNNKEFDKFIVNKDLELEVFTFFSIDKKIKTNTLIGQLQIKNALGLYLSELDFTQARIAESVKFLETTCFFDGGFDGRISKCDKINVPSLSVEEFQSKPEMSAMEVTKKAIQAMNADYDFILVDYANLDIVGLLKEKSVLNAASYIIDACLKMLLEKAEDNFYKVIILGDYDNLKINGELKQGEEMLVPFLIKDEKINIKDGGSLVNVAPSILDYMDIAIPIEMENVESLIEFE
jgi:2,3-bisphosphoglycerate-independent phosphoglycerate mutase